MLKEIEVEGTVTVKWQGEFLDLPVRSIRPHRNFLGLHNANTQSLTEQPTEGPTQTGSQATASASAAPAASSLLFVDVEHDHESLQLFEDIFNVEPDDGNPLLRNSVGGLMNSVELMPHGCSLTDTQLSVKVKPPCFPVTLRETCTQLGASA
jgi:hypothetical protein